MARDTLFSLLPAKLADGLIAQASTVALAPDQVLFRTGDACDGCYHVIEGLLKDARFQLISADYHPPLYGTYLAQKPLTNGESK